MRATQNEVHQELCEVIEYMNERQEKLMSTMERKKKLMGLEVELLEKKQATKDLLKERRRTKVEGCRDTLASEDGILQKEATGSRSFEAEGDLFVRSVRNPGRRRRREEQ